MERPFRYVLLLLLAITIPITVMAHPGRTDGRGGHTDHSTGEYHYHHGYSAHQHYDIDGDGKADCPYDFKDATKPPPSAKTEGGSKSTGESSTSNDAATFFGKILPIVVASTSVALYLMSLFAHAIKKHDFAGKLTWISIWAFILLIIYVTIGILINNIVDTFR